MIFSISCNSQNQSLIELSKQEYDMFPDTFDIQQKVFSHYYDFGFAKNKAKGLNDAQKVICYYFVCDGLIDNGGFISILQETSGGYNDGFLIALKDIKDENGYNIFLDIVSIYKDYRKYFNNQEIPPQLDEESDKFDKDLESKLNTLEDNWYKDSSEREKF